jgi:hypothetical protein
MTQIAYNIWVGGYTDSLNASFTSQRNITHILCCAAEFETAPGYLVLSKQTERWHRLAIDKTIQINEVLEGARKLDEWVRAGHNVILHCSGTYERSALVAIAYFIRYRGWAIDIAISHVKYRVNCTVHRGFCENFVTPIM